MKLFALAIFFGAFLLFSLQPMMGKFILPWFGGGTAVWSTCMLFFQVVLLGGYAYAHFSARWFRPRSQALVHLALVCAAVVCLPVIPNSRWQPAASADPTLSILLLLMITVGLPYFVLSATGPLMQHWFSLTKPGMSPYPLFALSNAGSLAALASYPFFFEPLFTRKTQALIWSGGMGLFAVFAAACAWMLWRARIVQSESAPVSLAEEVKPGAGTKILWLLLSACASALMLAITNKMCLDVIVMPFLWVLPLALYLLSFIWSFAGAYKRRWHGGAVALPLLLVCYVLYDPPQDLLFQIPVFAFTLFYCCLVCHGELYQLKPSPRYLTAFYLMIATGGALGGIFVAVVSPMIFNDYFELQWILVLLPVLITVIHLREGGQLKLPSRRYPIWQLSAVVSVLLGLIFFCQAKSSNKGRVAAVRNFYGVLKLSEMAPGTPHAALGLYCGTTLHGFQLLQPGLEDIPAGYYHERTGIGLLKNALSSEKGRRFGVVGLGTGTLATYGRTNDVIRFYEINPMDIQIAKERFSYLSRCKAQMEIVPGDARLSMEREPPQRYDMLVLDAFNSDTIPVHLLTEEAFQVYDRHLKSSGVIAAHISSKHLNLSPVLESLARKFNMDFALMEWAPLRENRWGAPPIPPWQTFDCVWFLLSRNQELMNSPEIRKHAAPVRARRNQVRPWTDDYTSLLPFVIWD